MAHLKDLLIDEKSTFLGDVEVKGNLIASGFSKMFAVGTTAPTNTNLLWIDTTEEDGGLKYHNGTEWVHVPVSYT